MRRVPYRFSEWADRAFDYGQPAVREYHLALVRELSDRYDFDGLELDWMRFGFHFRPGHEREGAGLLTEFTARVRALLDECEQRRGHKIRLSARVPSRPQAALGLGMDALTWARRGLIDMLVVTPFWASAETDIPIELWKQLLDGTGVTLAAGLEVLLRPSRDWPLHQTNSLETARGDDLHNYPTLLRELGSTATLSGKSRRHVLTFADTWAPGEPRAALLPLAIPAGAWGALRIHCGPAPEAGEVVSVALDLSAGDAPGLEVRVNGEPCSAQGAATLPSPAPDHPLQIFAVPPSTMNRGYNLIEVHCPEELTISWAEFSIQR